MNSTGNVDERLLLVLLLSRWPPEHITGRIRDDESTGYSSPYLLSVFVYRPQHSP